MTADERATADDSSTAFAELFAQTHRRVLGYVLRAGATVADADDVVADVYVVAWRRFDDIPTDDPVPWLLAVARNVARNQRRSRRRGDALLDRLQSQPIVAGTHDADTVADVAARGTHAEMVVTVAADTGLLQSIRTVSFVDDGPQGYVRQTVVTFDSGDDPPAVVAPTNTEDVTYEELCALPDMSCELPEEATP